MAKGKLVRQARGSRVKAAGFTMIELVLVLVVSLILTAMAIPTFSGAIASYELNGAVESAESAIQGTRYQAIMHGYQYEVTIDPTHNTFQVLSEIPPATSFSNVGSSVPLSGVPVTVSALTTLLEKPNGSVSATAGAMSFTISYKGTTKTLTVSNYGSVSVQ
jgi:prepilin-type N-terminal cleavage/methylation domain-containing protein